VKIWINALEVETCYEKAGCGVISIREGVIVVVKTLRLTEAAFPHSL